VPELFFTGLLIGAIVGAPIGPVGTATLLELTAGSYRRAVAGMSGCIAAEIVLLFVAVFGTGRLSAYLISLPKIVPVAVGMVMLAIGLYYLIATRMPRLGSATTFLIAFKITLLAPNNLAALIALIVAMGLAARLNGLAHDAVFMVGEFLGVMFCWLGLLWLGWRLRRHPSMPKAVPWLRRGTGAIMIIAGTIIIARQFFPL
jgi:arginine exporter protein ArgO